MYRKGRPPAASIKDFFSVADKKVLAEDPEINRILEAAAKDITIIDEDGVAHGYTEEDDNEHGD